MARGEDEKHWLLRRQLQEQSEGSLPEAFLRSVNKAYRIFDDNYLRIKLILRRKIYQLVESNARLQALLQERENQLDQDRIHLKKLVDNFNRAEIIAHLGSFTWYSGSASAEYSENLFQLIGLQKTERSVPAMLRKFDNPLAIIAAIRRANLLNNVVIIENLKLRNEARYFDIEAHVIFNAHAGIDRISGIIKENTRWVHVNNRAEDQKKFYESILNNIPVDIAIFNYEHKYMYLNPMAVSDQDVRDFLLGRDDFDYCRVRNLETSKAEARRATFLKARESKQAIDFEDVGSQADGSPKYTLRRFVPVLDPSGEFAFMLGYGVDVTLIKIQELSLEASLREKELLLGEIHHSVKNNLTLIVALLEINSAHEKSELVKKYFGEIRNRISALALIYDKLYRSEVFNLINLNEYIASLVLYLQQSILPGRRDVAELEIDQIYVDNKTAVPLALLVNELVSNAFLHAFPASDCVRLRVSLKHEGDHVVRLVVSDTGAGLPQDLDIAKGRSFGFKLIGLFARQLKGKLHVENSNGLTVDVEFQNMQFEVQN
jgi:two-component sensor histidine kinase